MTNRGRPGCAETMRDCGELEVVSEDSARVCNKVWTPSHRRAVQYRYRLQGVIPTSEYCFLIDITSWPPQEKVFIWPPFFQYHKRLLRQKTGGACLYMPQDGPGLHSCSGLHKTQNIKQNKTKTSRIKHTTRSPESVLLCFIFPARRFLAVTYNDT